MSIRSIKKEVMLLRPDDNRFDTLEVIDETDLAVVCREGNRERRFWKHGPGWSHGKTTVFLVLEGMPVTTYFKNKKEVTANVEDFLIDTWGENVYNNMIEQAPELRDKIMSNWGASVSIDPVVEYDELDLETRLKLLKLKATDWLKESAMVMFDTFGKSTPKQDWKKNVMRDVGLLLLGAFAMYFGVKQGII